MVVVVYFYFWILPLFGEMIQFCYYLSIGLKPASSIHTYIYYTYSRRIYTSKHKTMLRCWTVHVYTLLLSFVCVTCVKSLILHVFWTFGGDAALCHEMPLINAVKQNTDPGANQMSGHLAKRDMTTFVTILLPMGSMYGIFTYIWLIFMVNVKM